MTNCQMQTQSALIHTENLVVMVFADSVHLELVHMLHVRDELPTHYI